MTPLISTHAAALKKQLNLALVQAMIAAAKLELYALRQVPEFMENACAAVAGPPKFFYEEFSSYHPEKRNLLRKHAALAKPRWFAGRAK